MNSSHYLGNKRTRRPKHKIAIFANGNTRPSYSIINKGCMSLEWFEIYEDSGKCTYDLCTHSKVIGVVQCLLHLLR